MSNFHSKSVIFLSFRLKCNQKAEASLKYYKGYKGESQKEDDAIYKEFERLKAIVTEQKQEEKFVASEFCKQNKITFKPKNLVQTSSFFFD